MVVVFFGATPPGPRRVTRFQSRVDRISALPDDLLLQVLARLRCARTATRTSLLARRWRRVWRDLPEVTFRGLALDAIHAALTQITRTSLEAIDIHVSTGHRERDAGSVTALLRAAADLSPLKLVLTIPLSFLHFTPFTVDLPRFNFATSIELDVSVGGVRFALPPAMEFPKLETLSLSGCTMDLAALVPRCPCLRILSVITGTPYYRVDTITVHSASLQELVVSAFLFTSTIDIVAPALRKLTLAMEYKGIDNRLSVVAPMVEEVTWRCLYNDRYVTIGKWWSVASLEVRVVDKAELTDNNDDEGSHHQPSRAHVLSLHIFDIRTRYPSQKDFAEELKEIPITTFSVLELKISAWRHFLGPVVLNLLQICTAVRRLDMVFVDNKQAQVMADTWPCKWCPCEKDNRKWRTETTFSSINLTEVEIKGLKGDEEEIHFLKLLFRCAPMLQTMTVILPDKVTSAWYNIFLDTVREYPYVKSSVCISLD